MCRNEWAVYIYVVFDASILSPYIYMEHSSVEEKERSRLSRAEL